MMDDNREVLHPKVTFRMPRDRVHALRVKAAEQGMTLSALFNVMAIGILNGRVVIDARNVQPWERNND